MKKEKREVYLALTEAAGCDFCTFCKYNEGACDASECTHPLGDSIDFPGQEFFAPGDDCWGFRPAYKLEYIVDLVGIILANGYRMWSVEHKGDKIIVHGSTKEPW
jgi:hypothetical protein